MALIKDRSKLIRERESILGASLDLCQSKVEEAVAASEALKEEVSALRREHGALRDRDLEERVATAEQYSRVNDATAEQYSRVNDVKVHGVPFKKGENLPEILDSLGNALAYLLS